VKRSSTHAALLSQAVQRLSANPRARPYVVDALTPAGTERGEAEFARVAVLLSVNRKDIGACLDQLDGDKPYTFEALWSDGPSAHRKAAAIQDVLSLLGYYLGPRQAAARGYYGGPPGKPLVQDLKTVRQLIAKTPYDEKLVAQKPFRRTESWTRDAVRRLQAFLGSQNLGERIAPRGSCLVRPDGLFGERVLRALRTVVRTSGR
jgi:hypothetical protein